jgi:pyridoxine kinase
MLTPPPSIASSFTQNTVVDHLLSGYIGSVSFLRAVLAVYSSILSVNPNIRYICDPVLGDNGKFYVPKELVEIYRDEVLKVACIITPNQFEAEKLSGVDDICDIESAKAAINALHALGPEIVVITRYVDLSLSLSR